MQSILQVMDSTLLGDPHVLPARAKYFQAAIIEHSLSSSTILRIPHNRLKGEEFRLFLRQRVPLVITNLNGKLQLTWSPNQLTEDYGSDDCTMEDCEGISNPMATKIHHFLSYFHQRRDDVIWKVKVSQSHQCGGFQHIPESRFI